ncbi:MAG: hypothetical protein HW402_1464, partial [Dehalococcoidales bacterium]|nr:hypothetical protein [Dehalococcoidales bacterium]
SFKERGIKGVRLTKARILPHLTIPNSYATIATNPVVKDYKIKKKEDKHGLQDSDLREN